MRMNGRQNKNKEASDIPVLVFFFMPSAVIRRRRMVRNNRVETMSEAEEKAALRGR